MNTKNNREKIEFTNFLSALAKRKTTLNGFS